MDFFIVSIENSLLVIDVWGIGKSWEIWIKKGKFLEYQPRVGDNSVPKLQSKKLGCFAHLSRKVRSKAPSELSKDIGVSQ
jgi:hypothetical protein